jgi:hypothetical protein
MKCPGARISPRCTRPLESTQSLNHTGRSEVPPAKAISIVRTPSRVVRPRIRTSLYGRNESQMYVGTGTAGAAALDLPGAVPLARVPRVPDPHGPERIPLLFDVTLEGVRRREGVGRVHCRPETRGEVLLEAVAGECAHGPDRPLERFLSRCGGQRRQAEGRPAIRRGADIDGDDLTTSEIDLAPPTGVGALGERHGCTVDRRSDRQRGRRFGTEDVDRELVRTGPSGLEGEADEHRPGVGPERQPLSRGDRRDLGRAGTSLSGFRLSPGGERERGQQSRRPDGKDGRGGLRLREEGDPPPGQHR